MDYPIPLLFYLALYIVSVNLNYLFNCSFKILRVSYSYKLVLNVFLKSSVER